MERAKRISQIEELLRSPVVHEGQEFAGRELIWFGPRGSDALGLSTFFRDDLAGAFSLYDRFPRVPAGWESKNFLALEDLTRRRRLSRVFDEIPEDLPGEYAFRRQISECLKSVVGRGKVPTVLAYEPHLALETLILQNGVAEFLGNDMAHFRRFSSKPRVEKELRKLDVPVIEWRAVETMDEIQGLQEMYSGIVVRRDGGSSGKGIISVREHEFEDEGKAQDIRAMFASSSAAVSAAELHENAISLNQSGVVFPKRKSSEPAQVAMFPVSAQIVGVPELTDLEFGYCGNDFAFGVGLPDDILGQCDDILQKVGQYLGENGYVGAFGVDYLLLQNGRVLFTEVNARFQGSTRLLSRLSTRAHQSDVLTEHLAATLGLKFGGTWSSAKWAGAIAPFSQMYLHNMSGGPIVQIEDRPAAYVANDPNVPTDRLVEYEMCAGLHDVVQMPGSLTERIVVRGGVLNADGRTLTEAAKHHIGRIEERYTSIETDRNLIGHPEISDDR